MQFAGQRTDKELHPIGEPVNVLIKLTDDVLPDPSAILLTGITPQRTNEEGISEADFLKLFYDQIALPGTIFTGFNSVRFDDEFMRFINYRNFYDPYEWQWRDNRSRWDMLDVTRMTRALRPEGIVWPKGSDGTPANRLTDLSAANKLDHISAHDALSDVEATIGLARLIRSKQPKLFDYLLELRDKKKISALASSGKPFVYTSGKYPSEYEKTTVVIAIAKNPNRDGGVLVYDLRHDPEEFATMSPEQLAEAWSWRPKDDTGARLPVKTLQFNRCPAIAPLGVLDSAGYERLSLDKEVIESNRLKLDKFPEFSAKLELATEIMDKKRDFRSRASSEPVDAQLYDGFFSDQDKSGMAKVRDSEATAFNPANVKFQDKRLNLLLPLYKARNYRSLLSDEERREWENYRWHKFTDGGSYSRAAKFGSALQLAATTRTSSRDQSIIEDLKLYAESIIPAGDG